MAAREKFWCLAFPVLTEQCLSFHRFCSNPSYLRLSCQHETWDLPYLPWESTKWLWPLDLIIVTLEPRFIISLIQRGQRLPAPPVYRLPI